MRPGHDRRHRHARRHALKREIVGRAPALARRASGRRQRKSRRSELALAHPDAKQAAGCERGRAGRGAARRREPGRRLRPTRRRVVAAQADLGTARQQHVGHVERAVARARGVARHLDAVAGPNRVGGQTAPPERVDVLAFELPEFSRAALFGAQRENHVRIAPAHCGDLAFELRRHGEVVLGKRVVRERRRRRQRQRDQPSPVARHARCSPAHRTVNAPARIAV